MKATYVIAIVLLVIAGCTQQAGIESTHPSEFAGTAITVYKSASCGCCVGYAAELDARRFDVTTVLVDDLSTIKDRYGIPRSMESCHTAVVNGYFVEGHVPFEAVSKLLSERPDVDGIALPAMPAGSPGMPGQKVAPFVVYSLSGGQETEFVRV